MLSSPPEKASDYSLVYELMVLFISNKTGVISGKNLGKPPLCLANALAKLFARRD